MKIRYFRKSKGKISPIYLSLYSGNTQELIFTGHTIDAKGWNPIERAPRDTSSDLFHAIEKIKNAVLKQKRIMEINDEPVTPFSLKIAYKKTIKKQSEKHATIDKKEKHNIAIVSTLIDDWIDKRIDHFQRTTKAVAKASLRAFQSYIKANYPKLLKKDLTKDVLNNYAKHLEKKKLADSTHAQRMKHLRWFMKAIDIAESTIKSVKIKTIKPGERNIIHLTSEELKMLEAVDVSFSLEWQKAKDMFLVGCYTGLRISDIKRISPHRINNGAIEMTLQKNRTKVSIPLLSATEAILKKYDYSAPKISEQAVNECIKLVCEKAKINQKVYFKSKKQGQLIESLKPKHKLIHSHIAGKTFISLAGELWGLSPSDVSAITGKDIKTILGYYLKPDIQSAKQKMIEADNRSKMKAV